MLGSVYSPAWYSLTETSPAIDAGKVLTETNVDFYGHNRGALPDIGAVDFYTFIPTAWIFIPLILNYSGYYNEPDASMQSHSLQTEEILKGSLRSIGIRQEEVEGWE